MAGTDKKIVGLHGFAQVGKDTAANYLVERQGYRRIAFADPMRSALLKLNPWVNLKGASGEVSSWNESKFQSLLQFCTLHTLVDELGWDVAKTGVPEVRQLLQRFGTEIGRDMFGENFWVDLAMKQVDESEHPRWVFTDMRFPNELEAVKARGGTAVKLVRPGYGPVNGHVSDAGLPDELFDALAFNDGSVQHLEEQMLVICA
jgi:hypothetical protein